MRLMPRICVQVHSTTDPDPDVSDDFEGRVLVILWGPWLLEISIARRVR